MMLFVTLQPPTHAQFVNLNFKIEPEISATVEQDLSFGTQIANSGRTEIQLGDVNMGVFSIRALHTQNLFLSLNYPDALKNTLPGTDAEIPLELNINYNNSGTNVADRSIRLNDNNGFVSVHESTNGVANSDIWQQIYLYIYGCIDIGNVPYGVYTADIILSIDYD